MDLGFSGEVVDLYRRYRHGYPREAVAAIVERLGLDARDLALDLGCGTGQLTLPLASAARVALGVDPEPDMLSMARQEAERAAVPNVGWLLGSDASLPLLAGLLGERSIGVLTVAQALHWMDHRRLFAAARPLIRTGGGIAILSNGTPLWLQETDWSAALKAFLETWFDAPLTARCGTDSDSQRRYADDFERAGYAVDRIVHQRTVELDFAQLAGGVLSAMAVSQLPAGERRHAFLTQLRAALGPAERFEERVPVVVIIGRR